MSTLPKSVEKLIEEFSRLPGIGPKSASRLTFYLLNQPKEDVERFAKTLADLQAHLVSCSICFNIAETDPCEICSNKEREQKEVMVVEEPLDVLALEKTGYKGRYHVLHGVISPIDGIGPENLKIAELLDRLSKDTTIEEVILATDPTLEGEATAMYISRQIEKGKEAGKFRKIKVTRIARGLPVGGDLEYADEVTLQRALEGRKEY
jgi:recombination protein RecR